MVTVAAEIYNLVHSFTRKEFHENVLQGAALTLEFSKFADDPANTTVEEKNKLREALLRSGIPNEAIDSDEKMLETIKIISDRAVNLD